MITIGIAAYKEPGIVKALAAIAKQEIPEEYEIIVACPDDLTASVVKTLMNKNKRIKLIEEKKREGQPAAYNKILKKAEGRIILYTDADALLENDSIRLLVEAFEDENVGAVGGRPKPLNKRDNMFGFWAHFLFDMGHKFRENQVKRGDFYYISGPILAIRKGVIEEMPKNAMATDAVLGLMIREKGWKVVYVPEATVYQKAPTTFEDYFAQKRRTMAGFYQIKKWFPRRTTRSMGSEASLGLISGLKYSRNLRELWWFKILVLTRIAAWFLSFWDLRVRKKGIEEIWTTIESTK